MLENFFLQKRPPNLPLFVECILGSIPDEPGVGGYQSERAAKTNSVIDQARTEW